MTYLIAFQLFALIVLTSRNLIFVFYHSKLNRFESQLFSYLRHFISFTLNSYLLQICKFSILFTLHNPNYYIIIKIFIFRKHIFQNGCLFLKLDTLFQNGCLFLKMTALGYFPKLPNFSVSGFLFIGLFLLDQFLLD